MYFPDYRPRRLRRSAVLRRMVRETVLTADDLIYPMFVVPGTGVKKEIGSMPGQYHLSVDRIAEEAAAVYDLGVPAVILFGLPEFKDESGSSGALPDGVVQEAIRRIKDQAGELTVITDVCLCEYTSPRPLRAFSATGRWTTMPPWSTWPHRPSPMPKPGRTWWPRRT